MLFVELLDELIGDCWGSLGELLGSCWDAVWEFGGRCWVDVRFTVSTYTPFPFPCIYTWQPTADLLISGQPLTTRAITERATAGHTSGQPLTTSGQPLTTVGQPLATSGQPLATIGLQAGNR